MFNLTSNLLFCQEHCLMEIIIVSFQIYSFKKYGNIDCVITWKFYVSFSLIFFHRF